MRLILSILFCCVYIFGTAQDTKTAIKFSFQSLSDEEKAEILAYAIFLNGDMDKKMNKALKKLTVKEQELLLRRIQGMEPALEEPVVLSTTTTPLEIAEAVEYSTLIKFEEQEHDFGAIKEGDRVTHIFTFENIGKEPLTISNARGSCGCTVPEWTKEPIAPGKKGEIKVIFDSKNKKGWQIKTITITANTSPEKNILKIIAEVK